VADEIINGLQPIVGQPHPVERLTLVPSGGGIFEVRKNGEIVYSKKQMGRKPEPGEILKIISE
jgi:selenoprotein W-related protein